MIEALSILYTFGGIFIFPLILLSVLSFAWILERTFLGIRCRRSYKLEEVREFLNEVKQSPDVLENPRVSSNRVVQILISCVTKKTRHVEGKVRCYLHVDRMAYEDARMREAEFLGRHLEKIKAATILAPMFGFVGSVSGLQGAFGDLSNLLNMASISSNVHRALSTTLVGLLVAILCQSAFMILAHFKTKVLTELAWAYERLSHFLPKDIPNGRKPTKS